MDKDFKDSFRQKVQHESGSRYVVESIFDFIPSREVAEHRILNFVAKDNHIGCQLRKMGFNKIDGLVFSETTLERMDVEAYTQIHYWKFESEALSIGDDYYDSITAYELFNMAGVPFALIMTEMIRVVNQGGFISFVLKKEFAETEECCPDSPIESFIKKLLAAQAWQLVKKELKPKCVFGEDGHVYVFKVNIPGTVMIV